MQCLWPFSRYRWIISPRRVTRLQNPSKLTEKHIDNFKQIIRPKLNRSVFTLPRNVRLTDNPSLWVWKRPMRQIVTVTVWCPHTGGVCSRFASDKLVHLSGNDICEGCVGRSFLRPVKTYSQRFRGVCNVVVLSAVQFERWTTYLTTCFFTFQCEME